MKLGRIKVQTPDGPVARLVMVHPKENRVVDLVQAQRLQLEASGATSDAALRLAKAIFPASMTAAIGLGDRLLDCAHEVNEVRGADASAELDKQMWYPAADPSVLRDFVGYTLHLKHYHEKIGQKLSPYHYEIPAYYKGTPTMCFGQNDTIPWPAYTDFMDYELEVGFVIGTGNDAGRNLNVEEARKRIFGLTVFNDYSARDYQKKEAPTGMGAAKCKDFANGIGPWITTVDEFDDFLNIKLQARVNGEVWSEGSTAGLQWLPEEQLAFISMGEDLVPGDVFGCGTMGNGSTMESGKRLRPGDVLELEVEGVGSLRQTLGQPEAKGWEPTKRDII